MTLAACAQAFATLREGRIWALLASADAVTTLALFHELFMQTPTDRELPQSVLLDRLEFSLDELRAQGLPLEQTAPGYVTYWRAKGWLARKLPPGAQEEVYSLTVEAATAVRLMLQQIKPRTTVTESRLASVMHQASQLAKETNPDGLARIQMLLDEKARIDAELERLNSGEVETLADDRAIERAKELIRQANELTDDFHQVKGAFERLTQTLRTSLLKTAGRRGDALGEFFGGMELVNGSPEGRAFTAFTDLLTNPERDSQFDEAIDAIVARRFATKLSDDERIFLLTLKDRLREEAAQVHKVKRQMGSNLNRFVQSDVPNSSKRITSVLHVARCAALEVKDTVDHKTTVLALTHSVAQIRSMAQHQLHDPTLAAPAAPIARAQASSVSLADIQKVISQSEIDFKSLKNNIRDALATRTRVTLQELLTAYPVGQGFGTVLGYVNLGVLYGHMEPQPQRVSWVGRDAVTRVGAWPTIFFTTADLKNLNGKN